jgi:hypothetical protein
VEVWIHAEQKKGPPAVPEVTPQRPYYVVFQITFPKPIPSRFSKKGEEESTESFQRRLDALSLQDVKFEEIPTKDYVLPIHISGDALKLYPRERFAKGSRFSLALDGKGR